jgi:hypothetical protein
VVQEATGESGRLTAIHVTAAMNVIAVCAGLTWVGGLFNASWVDESEYYNFALTSNFELKKMISRPESGLARELKRS